MSSSLLQTLDTVLYADAVAWNQSLLACGTYQLQEEERVRKGGVLLYKLLKGTNDSTVDKRYFCDRACNRPMSRDWPFSSVFYIVLCNFSSAW